MSAGHIADLIRRQQQQQQQHILMLEDRRGLASEVCAILEEEFEAHLDHAVLAGTVGPCLDGDEPSHVSPEEP